MKCLLHIGTEKTGTTMLQNWLYSNVQALSKQGIALSQRIGKTNNRKLAACFQSRFDDFYADRQIRTQAEKQRYFDGFLDGFAHEIRALSEHHHTLVITSEHFHSRLADPGDIAALGAFLQDQFETVRILCYFREQSELRRSSYSTALRVGVAETIEEFQRDITPTSHFYNYDLMFSKWAQVFGWGNVQAAIYDRAGFAEGDLRRDFIRRVAGGVNEGALDFTIETANEKLSAVQAAMIRAVNIVFPRYHRHGLVNRTRMDLQRIIANNSTLDRGRIADPRQAQFHNLFDGSNRAFGRKFLGCEDNPFPRPDQDPDRAAPIDADEIDGILNSFVTSVFGKTGAERKLFTEDTDLLRQVAMKYETGAAVTRAEALALLELAQAGRAGDDPTADRIAAWRGEDPDP